MLTCPVCGDSRIESSTIPMTGVKTLFGTKITYSGVENHCLACGEKGDFDAANTPAIESAFEAASRDGLVAVLNNFNAIGFTDVSMERVLRLPIGKTIKRWRDPSQPLAPEVAPLVAMMTIKNLTRLDA